MILLFKGITALLKMVPSTDVTPTGDGDNVKQMSAGDGYQVDEWLSCITQWNTG
ncbi:MAG: hypothetical protein CM15mV13_0870 [uncultured marine virus]|nr:MAG: hypothetical protein CM15mV13_0870 [uncultured marine virus]